MEQKLFDCETMRNFEFPKLVVLRRKALRSHAEGKFWADKVLVDVRLDHDGGPTERPRERT